MSFFRTHKICDKCGQSEAHRDHLFCLQQEQHRSCNPSACHIGHLTERERLQAEEEIVNQVKLLSLQENEHSQQGFPVLGLKVGTPQQQQQQQQQQHQLKKGPIMVSPQPYGRRPGYSNSSSLQAQYSGSGLFPRTSRSVAPPAAGAPTTTAPYGCTTKKAPTPAGSLRCSQGPAVKAPQGYPRPSSFSTGLSSRATAGGGGGSYSNCSNDDDQSSPFPVPSAQHNYGVQRCTTRAGFQQAPASIIAVPYGQQPQTLNTEVQHALPYGPGVPITGKVECQVCGEECDVSVSPILCSLGTHCVCRECFSSYVAETWIENTRAKISQLNAEPRVPCVDPSCVGEPFTKQFVVSHTTQSAGEAFLEFLDHMAEVRTLARAQSLAAAQSTPQGPSPSEAKRAADRAENALFEAQILAEHQAGGDNSRKLMCPRCYCGPVDLDFCPDLTAHHGQAHQQSRVSNACLQCNFFAASAKDWLPWDGVFRNAGSSGMSWQVFKAKCDVYLMVLWLPMCWFLVAVATFTPWVTVGCIDIGLFKVTSSCNDLALAVAVADWQVPGGCEPLREHLEAASAFAILTWLGMTVSCLSFFLQDFSQRVVLCCRHLTLILLGTSWLFMMITWAIVAGFYNRQVCGLDGEGNPVSPSVDPTFTIGGLPGAKYSHGFDIFVVCWVFTFVAVGIWFARKILMC